MGDDPLTNDPLLGMLFAKGSDTSEAAAESVKDVTGRLRIMIYGFIKRRADHGATCDEIEDVLDLRHQTASARVYELRNQGAIRDSDRRRLTRSGRKAVVWVLPQFALPADEEWR